MIGINRKVWLLNSRKTDGRYNKGKIVGIEKAYHGLGFMTETQYLNDFELYQYKVAYVDVFTGKGCAEWVSPRDVSITKPDDAV